MPTLAQLVEQTQLSVEARTALREIVRRLGGSERPVAAEYNRRSDASVTATDVDWDSGRFQYRAFAANQTLTFTDPAYSGPVTLAIYNSSGGSITITLPAVSTLGSTTVLTSDVNYLFYWYDDSATSVERYILISEENANVVPLVLTATLPDGVLDESYTGTLSATGGVSPYNYSITTGALPTGLSLNASSGAVSGTPTVEGVYSLTATVTDSLGNTDDSAESITISETTLLLDLISWWDFEEEGNFTVTRVDSHGSNHFDSNSNITDVDSGLVGKAIGPAAAGGYVSRADANLSGLDFTTGDFTLACWYRSQGTDNNTGLMSRYDTSGDNRIYTLVVEGGRPKFGLSTGGTAGTTTTLDSGVTPVADTWHLCVAWRDTAANLMYLQVDNGTPVSTAFSGSNSLHTGTCDFHTLVLNLSLYGSPLNVDSQAAWARKLTDSERTALYNSGAGLQYSDL